MVARQPATMLKRLWQIIFSSLKLDALVFSILLGADGHDKSTAVLILDNATAAAAPET